MSAPAQQQPRFSGVRRAAVGVVSGSAVVGALTMANAPWEAVVLTVLGTLVVSLALGLAPDRHARGVRAQAGPAARVDSAL